MIKLTWADLNDPNFVKAMRSLNHNNKLDRITAYRVGRICETAQKEMEKARKVEESLRKKHSADVKEGEPEAWKDKTGDAFMKDFNETLRNHTVEIKVHKLHFDGLEGLSGAEFVALEKIVDGLPVEA